MHFFREVRIEFNKINWPGRTELTALTILVLLTVFMLALYIGVLDFGFRQVVQQLLKR
jgi:preprotein translocase subunit SecE